jgi:RNA polymerase sigma-70 factor (ECF subfamily)
MSDKVPAFDAIYREYQPKLLRYLDGMVGATEAEELTQETLLKVSRSLATFREEAQLSTWIYRVATNTARDRLRTRSFQASAAALSLDGEDEEPPVPVAERDPWSGDEAPPIPEAVARSQMSACIRGVVDELPEDYRAVLLLSEFEGLKDREIAEVLGTSTGAVKIRLHRARAALKAALDCACTFHRDERNEFGCEPTPDHAARLQDRRRSK